MSFVDLDPQPLTASAARPRGFVVTPGADDVNLGSDAPSPKSDWSSTFSWVPPVSALGMVSTALTPVGMAGLVGAAAGSPVTQAAFRQDNTIGAYFAAENPPDYREEGFNPWNAIKGTKYEKRWESFVDVHNTVAADAVMRKIDQEEDDRKTLDAAPWWQSVPAQMVAGILDWPTLLPGGAFVRGAKGGFSIAKSAGVVGAAAGASVGVQELALHGLTETRTAGESAMNIGVSVVLGGLLGASGAKLLSDAEWQGAVRALENDLAALDTPRAVPEAMTPGSVGAAANMPTELGMNTIAGAAAGAVAKSTSRLNPLLRGLQSPSAATRETLTQLVENSVYLKKNMEGVASDIAVETLMKEWNAGLSNALSMTNTAYPEYRKAGGTLKRDEFREAVGRAMRRNDQSDDPFVTKVAQAWRADVFDPLKEAAIKAGLLPEDVTVETAASYLSRMWNRNRLIAREGEFKNIVAEWVTRQSPKWLSDFDMETAAKSAKLKGDKLDEYLLNRRLEREARFEDIPGSARSIADDVFNTLTGKTGEGGVRPEFITIKARGPLKERTFNIPDELVEDFLESDVEVIGRRYTRVMGADVEIANKFGSVDMAEQIQRIRDDFNRLRQGVTDEKELRRLSDAEADALGGRKSNGINVYGDIPALRDLLRGTRFQSPFDDNYGRISRLATQVNYIRAMGEVVLASLTDIIRPAMVHGLSAYMGGMAQLVGNTKAVKLSVGEAQLAGNVAERVLGARLATLSEIVDPYAARGPVERFMENMTNVASKWNGIRIWTDSMKAIASVMTQNRILAGVENFAKIKKSERAYLAYLGIDQSMAERIAKQFAEHGEVMDGVRVANTESWTDAVARRTYRAAMNKDIDSIIVQKSVADLPLFANTPIGRILLQFKSFALASHQKVLLRGLQEDQARFVGGLVAMTLMGMFVTYMKSLTGNRPEAREKMFNNPGWWIGEGLDRSGILSVPMEIANTFEKATGYNVIKSPLRMGDSGAGMSQKLQNRNLVGTLAGPSAGLIQDVGTVLGIPKQYMDEGEITKGQASAAKSLFPYNSYTGVRQMMNYVVAPPE